MIGAVLEDFRHAARTVVRNPGFAMVAALVLALGIGANTAIFSAVNAFFFRPLPFADPDRLVSFLQRLADHTAVTRCVDLSPPIPGGVAVRRDGRPITEAATTRLLTTQVGDIDLQIPKLRTGSFLPSILEPRRRVDQALYAVVMEAYVAGVSTRLPGRRPACRRH